MNDIVDWLRGLAKRRKSAFGEEGMAGCRFDEAATEIDNLRDMCIRREEFIANNNLWKEFSAWLAEPTDTGSAT